MHTFREEDYKALYWELHSIPPPQCGSKYNMSGIKLWLLTSPLRSWMELAWGLYRSYPDNADKADKAVCFNAALKQARDEIIQDEGERIISERLCLFGPCFYYVRYSITAP